MCVQVLQKRRQWKPKVSFCILYLIFGYGRKNKTIPLRIVFRVHIPTQFSSKPVLLLTLVPYFSGKIFIGCGHVHQISFFLCRLSYHTVGSSLSQRPTHSSNVQPNWKSPYISSSLTAHSRNIWLS